jgi:hypothetical protein
MNMKKLSFLFVALALVGFISVSSCKTSTKPAEEPTEESVEAVEEVVEEPVDTVAAPMEEEGMEESAE